MSYDEHLISQAGGDGDPLDAIQRRITDCQTYKFGMRNADKLAHEDAPYLLALVREQAAKLEAVRELADAAPTFAGFVDTGSVPVADLRAALEPTP